MQQAAEAMQAKIEEALGIDADTEVAAQVFDGDAGSWPEVTLTEAAAKLLLAKLDAIKALRSAVHAGIGTHGEACQSPEDCAFTKQAIAALEASR